MAENQLENAGGTSALCPLGAQDHLLMWRNVIGASLRKIFSKANPFIPGNTAYTSLTSPGFSSIAQVPLSSLTLAQRPASDTIHSEGGLCRPLSFFSSQVGNSGSADSEAGTRQEAEGRRMSHLHSPLQLLTSDRPVEGLERSMQMNRWLIHSFCWHTSVAICTTSSLYPIIAVLLSSRQYS